MEPETPLHNDPGEHHGKGRLDRLAAASVLTRFTVLGSAIVVLEVTLGTWPIVATSLWGSRAVDTWIHFLYWIKAVFLFLAVVQTRWAPWRFTMEGRNDPRPQRRGLERFGYLELCMGATASCELSTWILLSVIAHALLSTIVLLLVVVLQNEFNNNTQWILSVVFDGVAIVESVGSPLILTTLGLGPFFDVHPSAFYTVVNTPPPPPPPPTTTTQAQSHVPRSSDLYRSPPPSLPRQYRSSRVRHTRNVYGL